MPIECLRLHLDIQKLSLPSPVENWFQALASRNILKGLSLTICGKKLARNTNEDAWLTIPDAVFSSESLNTICLASANTIRLSEVRLNINPVIKCSCLRVLELIRVSISDGALHNILSSCRLLEKINLQLCQNLKRIKVNNLHCLRELIIRLIRDDDILEIDDVPSLWLFSYYSFSKYVTRMDTLGSVRELELCINKVDVAFFDMIKSKFPFLEILSLLFQTWMLDTLDITSVSLKRLSLYLFFDKQISIQVDASKSLYFSYGGRKMPSLSFPSNTPAHIKLILSLQKSHPMDLSYFLKVREALELSSNFDIEIEQSFVPLNIDLVDLRRMIPFPAMNVQDLSIGKHSIERWKNSPLLDLLFSIFYPRYVKVYYRSSRGKNYWYGQIVRMMEKKTPDLKDIKIKNPTDGKWKPLTNSGRSYHFLFELPWRSFYDMGNDYASDEFQLNWGS